MQNYLIVKSAIKSKGLKLSLRKTKTLVSRKEYVNTIQLSSLENIPAASAAEVFE